MKIFKETEIKNPLYTAKLDNGIYLFVFDGYAEGSDGCLYRCVCETDENGDIDLTGWVRKEHP